MDIDSGGTNVRWLCGGRKRPEFFLQGCEILGLARTKREVANLKPNRRAARETPEKATASRRQAPPMDVGPFKLPSRTREWTGLASRSDAATIPQLTDALRSDAPDSHRVEQGVTYRSRPRAGVITGTGEAAAAS